MTIEKTTKKTTSNSLDSITRLVETVHRLRAPNGCPWDRAQTHQSLRPYLIEEAYEVLDVLDQIKSTEDLKKEKIKSDFREELGDLLMQVLLHSEMANEENAFSFFEVAEALNSKLIRRHPHVFGDVKEDTAENAVKRWEKEKAKEKAGQIRSSVLDGVPRGLPTLQRSTRVIEKVTRIGFQWDDMQGPLAKVEEELEELKTEVLALEKLVQKQKQNLKSKPVENPPENQSDTQIESQTLRKRVESEIGDLLFTLCNVAFLNQVSPEDALRGTLTRFESRFRFVEKRLKWQGKTPEQSDLPEMDRYWDEAKLIEKAKVFGLTGGIASGKSSVGKILIELGIPVIDADQIARELSSEGGAAYGAILNRFGTVDRNRLREMIFSDPQAKLDLESILHPLIQAKSTDEILKQIKNHSVVIYEASLLVETGRHQDFDGLIVVEAPKSLRMERLLARNHMTQETAQSILDAQLSDEAHRTHAQFIIDNSGDLESLRQQVRRIAQENRWIS